ncbi:Epoxide hydrolase 1 [Hondaea fermentalgiana]|uniref:Epoxide hydrolase 1 n=1 Tax=Hondaea fermentalgiana TaxID=2315210 RepID=A0A2R5FZW4_9STRA|nr:Epoxide hydrolase 1 [Hondaea fermentalgiana]|eukprot:GBG23805.1 Epoxide hydrolase 1 [Hondaea fermentalgiana]
MTTERFALHVPDATLEDLRERLANRDLSWLSDFVPPERGDLPDLRADERLATSYANENYSVSGSPSAWRYGIDPEILEDVLKYFETDFLDNWREKEAKLNELPQYIAEVEPGVKIHYIHARCAAGDQALTVFLLHGWPSTLFDHHKVVPHLIARGYNVIVPSIPGFGYSQITGDLVPHSGAVRTAELYDKLACEVLGLPAYAVQGGDWGGAIGTIMAARSSHCIALHLNLPVAMVTKRFSLLNANKVARLAAYALAPSWTLGPREASAAENLVAFLRTNTGYFLQHVTKPATLGHALRESPAGLVAWIMEKFYICTDFRSTGNVFDAVSKDEILTTVMMFWATDSIASSMAFYRHCRNLADELPDFVSVPTALLVAPCEPLQMPRRLMDLSFNVRRYTELDVGGHFLPMEQPELLANDLAAFLKEVGAVSPTSRPVRAELSSLQMLRASLPLVSLPVMVGGAAALIRSRL